MKKPHHWDIFCVVVDNYGDIGVTWRLAKQLVKEYQLTIKLWVDDLNCFKHILPELNPKATQQSFNGVEIISWNQDTSALWQAGNVIIEAFACELPDEIQSQIEALKEHSPIWLNLEYLSAEDWIETMHGLPSIQHLGKKKYFFFPGFTPKSGGLICEFDLFRRQNDRLQQKNIRDKLLEKYNIYYQEQRIISVFSYESAALSTLVAHLITSEEKTLLLVPEGKSLSSISQALRLDSSQLVVGNNLSFGQLTLSILPMTTQEQYDELLWISDINIVRGEDSFLRAQWAKKPFIWHIYPQDDDAHIEKLTAFLQRYTANMPPELAEIQKTMMMDFNQNRIEDIVASWQSIILNYSALLSHAQHWPKMALNGSDLAQRLVEFIKKR